MNLVKVGEVLTMTSLEIVKYINDTRKEGEAELAHSDFLKKVPKVLNGGEGNFSSSYLNSQNKKQPCYKFPKREACLMAMSYSYDLQAKVFDHMTKLEAELESLKLSKVDKRLTHHPMMQALTEQRDELGKQTQAKDFINENKLCNWTVTGSFKAIDEQTLSVSDLQLLAFARRTNESLLMAGLTYDERKLRLAYKVQNKRVKLAKLLK
jgi:hypothetical protein